jgi:hypothetical protein
MRPLHVALVAAALALPAAARPDTTLALSAGTGTQTSPRERMPTNVMLAPGYALGPIRAELGIVGALADVTSPTTGRTRAELELRPMLVLAPPASPLYARAILAVTNLVDGPRDLAYGGALGLSFGMLGASAFVEAGALPRSIAVAQAGGGTKDELRWVVEGRLGAMYAF